ncbi:glycosyl hydrolase [Croceivirga radicis]|uniref:Glycosyl hydrolase n=1 Tax=Croceivirga radicis TaxID=1929488 RepID=A0A1V6LV89_9FLAO|nr:DUF1080 domain-containing protein [Croceivirga radicis]OQD44080.1 glycosyl hydrolase [Croceivirga radicis]
MRNWLIGAAFLAVVACKQEKKEDPVKEAVEEVSQEVAAPNWEVLFDGSSFDEWHYYNGGAVTEPWKIEDGAMVFYPPKERNGESYNLVTNKTYTNFVLQLEWKVVKGANSGIFYGVEEADKFGQPYATGPEIQVLDDENHPDAKNGTTHQAGALYDMVAPSEKTVKPIGEWNSVEIMVNHQENQGYVIQNGTKIVEFPVNGEAWTKMVENSKFKGWEGFGEYQTGKIGLQDHGDQVAFRNIRIKEL